ncbi:hypothetical protein K490DRAFT_68915 [Saccharata proteae CBS 121410]|uniref:Uncharacterized protein n=1 Tax=Saccharata proteae CBS 121410 TaxID=1314787 RepID=A0A9P4HP13_9PEZI|nr:hypothetical protein K490DRAFT_68915 [Saccharata proteae CBS 121410]
MAPPDKPQDARLSYLTSELHQNMGDDIFRLDKPIQYSLHSSEELRLEKYEDARIREIVVDYVKVPPKQPLNGVEDQPSATDSRPLRAAGSTRDIKESASDNHTGFLFGQKYSLPPGILQSNNVPSLFGGNGSMKLSALAQCSLAPTEVTDVQGIMKACSASTSAPSIPQGATSNFSAPPGSVKLSPVPTEAEPKSINGTAALLGPLPGMMKTDETGKSKKVESLVPAKKVQVSPSPVEEPETTNVRRWRDLLSPEDIEETVAHKERLLEQKRALNPLPTSDLPETGEPSTTTAYNDLASSGHDSGNFLVPGTPSVQTPCKKYTEDELPEQDKVRQEERHAPTAASSTKEPELLRLSQIDRELDKLMEACKPPQLHSSGTPLQAKTKWEDRHLPTVSKPTKEPELLSVSQINRELDKLRDGQTPLQYVHPVSPGSRKSERPAEANREPKNRSATPKASHTEEPELLRLSQINKELEKLDKQRKPLQSHPPEVPPQGKAKCGPREPTMANNTSEPELLRLSQIDKELDKLRDRQPIAGPDDIGTFNPGQSGQGVRVVEGSKTEFKDVNLFITRVQEENLSRPVNVLQCLRGDALEWYLGELNDTERSVLRHDTAEAWCTSLRKRFAMPTEIAEKTLQAIRFQMEDAADLNFNITAYTSRFGRVARNVSGDRDLAKDLYESFRNAGPVFEVLRAPVEGESFASYIIYLRTMQLRIHEIAVTMSGHSGSKALTLELLHRHNASECRPDSASGEVSAGKAKSAPSGPKTDAGEGQQRQPQVTDDARSVFGVPTPITPRIVDPALGRHSMNWIPT